VSYDGRTWETIILGHRFSAVVVHHSLFQSCWAKLEPHLFYTTSILTHSLGAILADDQPAVAFECAAL
jgi:hypothetical protein